jgi:O-antigen/teichoic acid export membrane protein
MKGAEHSEATSPVLINDLHAQRRSRIARVAITGAVARAAAFLPTFGIAPLAVGVLGAERFGVLMTIMSLVTLLSIADLGVGGSLVTGISRAVGAGNASRVRSLQANGLAIVAAMAALLALAAATLPFTSVGALAFPHSATAVQLEATHALACLALLFALTLPLTLVYKIQLGLQIGDVANRWQSLAGLINFGAAAFACRAGASIAWIIAGLLTGTLLCGLINTGLQLRSPSAHRPRWHDVRRRMLRRVLSDSLFYLAIQLIFLVTYTFDTLIVARQLGAQHASTYALAERLFSMVAVLVSIFTGPLWAAYGEALGRRDFSWARRCLRMSVRRLGLLSLVASAALLLLFSPLVLLLGRKALSPPIGVGISMALWRIIEAVGGAFAAYLMASRAMRLLLFTGAVTAVVSLTLKTLVLQRFGASVLPVVTTACYIAFSLLPSAIFIRRLHRSLPTGDER